MNYADTPEPALTPSEVLHITSLAELSENPAFHSTHRQGSSFGPIWQDFTPEVFDPEWKGMYLSPEIEACAPTFSVLRCTWSYNRSELAGEFDLISLPLAMEKAAPLPVEPASDEQITLLSQLHRIDCAPTRGTGEGSYIRIEPKKRSFEIWHQDRNLYDEQNVQAFQRMDVNYCGYLDTLRVTKGAFGWQLLYLDVKLSDYQFSEHLASIREMLDVFPEHFLDHDYEPLRARLEARL